MPRDVGRASLYRGSIILWVEDDVMIGTILGNKLISEGFDLIHVSTGEEAMYHLTQVTPQLIVLDLLLSGLNGMDILRTLHKDQNLQKIPVIILSNMSKESDVEEATALGVKKFLVKPSTSLEEIVKCVRAYCG